MKGFNWLGPTFVIVVALVIFYSLYPLENRAMIENRESDLVLPQQYKKWTPNIPIKKNELTVSPKKVSTDNKQKQNVIDIHTEIEQSLKAEIEEIVVQFSNNNFSRIIDYHHIISICNSIPIGEDELNEWIYSHADQVGLNIPFMEKQMEHCEQVPRKSYTELQTKYRHAISQGEPLAKLALAMLIPFESEEKISLLSDSADWSQDAVDMLAQRSLTPNELLSDEQRVFWLSISSIESSYGEEFVFSMADAKAMITYSKLAKIELLVEEWQTGEVYVRSQIRHNLTSEKSL